MFCFSDIPRNSFVEEIFRENCTIAQLNCSLTGGAVCRPGLLIKASSLAAASCSPSTSLAYSSCSLDASVVLILEDKLVYLIRNPRIRKELAHQFYLRACLHSLQLRQASAESNQYSATRCIHYLNRLLL